MAQKAPAAGHSAKHSGSHKHHHHKSKKHHHESKKTREKIAAKLHADAVAKHNKHAQPRGLALSPADFPCCPYEALAASLRLAGGPVGADDVLALYDAVTGGSGAPTSILAALEGAQRFGLAGAYPVFSVAHMPADGVVAGVTIPAGPHAVTLDCGGVWTWGEWRPVRRSFAAGIEEAWAITWH